MLAFRERAAIPGTLRLTIVVYTANILGATAFALLLIESHALAGAAETALVDNVIKSSAGGFVANFWSGVIVGWLLASVAWLVEASENAIGQAVVIFALTLIVALGGFDHCIASTMTWWRRRLDGEVGVARLFGWLGTVTPGNLAGGTLIVSLLNYGQIHAEEEAEEEPG